MTAKRIRDPLHNLIVFNTDGDGDGDGELDRALWKVMCSQPFQRLRRVKQLGFSEIVYPGASHSRFAHSLGVMETARRLTAIIQEGAGERSRTKEKIAIIAALVHDVGHGPFSHAFEEVGRRLVLPFASHEKMSDAIIRNGEIAEILGEELGSGCADDVADMIKGDGRKTLHNAVVSSQFDADRLDYMQRDRLMTGCGRSAVDFPWLLENLLIEEVETGIDDESTGRVPTFVIGPKAIHAAEAYVLDLFQLYPTVYFHKTTRGAEKIFVELLARLVEEVQNSGVKNTGLPARHPLAQLAKRPHNLELILQLDDTIIWGALPQLRDSNDPLICSFAERLQYRKLYKCVDIRTRVHHAINPENKNDQCLVDQVDRCCESILERLEGIEKDGETSGSLPKILTDSTIRSAYRQKSGSQGPIGQINIKTEEGALLDLRQRSEVVASIGDFKVTRAYFDRECGTSKKIIDDSIRQEVGQ